MNDGLHFVPTTGTFADVILPVAAPKAYTYYVPEEHLGRVRFGVRVEVQFGKSKLYSGLVQAVHRELPESHTPKPVIGVLDDEPIISEQQLRLWRWMADYYACTVGEVMNAALPANLKLSSETRVVIAPEFDGDLGDLDEREYLVAEALMLQKELSVEDVRKILGVFTVYPVVDGLIDAGVLYLKEEMPEKYRPRIERYVRLAAPYRGREDQLSEAFGLLARSNKQVEALMAYVQLERGGHEVTRRALQTAADVDASVLRAVAAKGVFELYEREVSRIEAYGRDLDAVSPLSEQQTRALTELSARFRESDVVLLHGVTGSGKTRVFVELIQAAIARGEQVLYLLPEIALTTQIVGRLRKLFGDKIAVYHSKLNNNERVEVYRAAAEGTPVVLGARSTVFLPFANLKWVIVDEEHDPSYKQHDPAPRYNGRDAAIYLAHLSGAKVLLGTATPAVETYHHVKTGKYGLVSMPERYGASVLPEIEIVDLRVQTKQKQMQSHFSLPLIEAIKSTVAEGRQAILFQNRRGYSPTLRCDACGWASECVHCDVTLTYHKHRHNLQCHYCGYHKEVVQQCPACGSTKLQMQGFGTEKLEDDLKVYLPELRISRLDLDTVRGKNAMGRIMEDFETKRVDVMIGTQMVTKGLDFENVGLVGVLNADLSLGYPDFRATERGFQLLTQVSGRSGRGQKRGKVLVQAYNVGHPVLQEIGTADYESFFAREIEERQQFKYPPFCRMITVTLKHKKPQTLNDATRIYTQHVRQRLGDRVIGPAIPHVSRIRNQYLLNVLLKLERDAKVIRYAKDTLAEAEALIHREPGMSQVRVNVDVDPV